MKKLLALVILLAIGMSVLPDDAEAQGRYRPTYRKNRSIANYKGARWGTINFSSKYIVLGVSVNANNYFGDLAPLENATSTDISFTRPGLGLTAGYHFTPWLTGRVGFNWVRLQGDDNTSAAPELYASLTRYTRNLQFRNDILEFSGGFEIDIIPNFKGPYSRAPINPYVFFGIAAFVSQPKALAPETAQNGNTLDEAGQWVKLRPLGTEGQFIAGSGVETYSALNLAIPLAVGVKIRLPGNFDAALEFGYRFIFTDYIDDVSGKYVDLGALDSDLARALSDRSSERIAVGSNQERDFRRIEEAGIGGLSSYVSEVNGERYENIPGYGIDGSIRGNSDNDMYFVTHIRVYYLLSKGRRAGYR